MSPARKRKPVEAGDGSYGGMVLSAFDALRACRVCGCTELNACPGGCCWVEEDLCSACVPEGEVARDPRTDPRQGDAITVGDETREVELVRDGRVYYSWPGKLAVRSLFASSWATWAANASKVVLGTGEPRDEA